MKNNLKWFFIVLGMFVIGGLGSLFVNYIVFSKLVTNPKWSEKGIVKALSNKVTVIQTTEKVVVKDNESLADISSQALSGLVYIEEVLPPTSSLLPGSGSGIVMTSDGVVVFHSSVFHGSADSYIVNFSDGTKQAAKKIYEDEYTGLVFLQVDKDDLTTTPFANSKDAFGGKKLINVYKENSEQTFYNLGILSGFDYNFQTNGLSCDYLQGAFRVDFNEKALEYGVGGPMIDFNGQVVGLLARKTDYINHSNTVLEAENSYFVIASNDINEAFNRFLNQKDKTEDSESERAVLEAHCGYYPGIIEEVSISASSNSSNKLAKPLIENLGLKNGDLILSIDDQKVDLKNPISKILLNYKKGDMAKFKIKRNGQEIEIEVAF